jgi:hypothetical protein
MRETCRRLPVLVPLLLLVALALVPAAEACTQDCVPVEGEPHCYQCVDLGYDTGIACHSFEPCYCVFDPCWSSVAAPVSRTVAMPEKPAWLGPAEGAMCALPKAKCGR